MQRLLTEAYAEFEFEEPAKGPGSVYVKRGPNETDKEETIIEETVEPEQAEQRRLNRSRGASTRAEAPQPEQRRLNQSKQSRGASTGAEAPQTEQRRLNRSRGASTRAKQAKACQPLRASFTSRSAPKAVHIKPRRVNR